MQKKDIWIVLPGFNEEKYLEKVLTKLCKYSTQIIFVDDGSSDATVQIAKKYLQHVLVHSINLGKGAAMKTGCEYAFHSLGAQAVIFMDSDDQHDPAELKQFYTHLFSGSAAVFGERKMGSEMPLVRIFGNRLASVLIYLLFGTYVPDIPSGFKALSKEAYGLVCWQSNRYEVELEIAAKVAKYKLPFTTVQITTIYHDLNRGMSATEAMRMLGKLLSWKIKL